MTIELVLCIVMMVVAFPKSRSIAAHYFALLLVNVAFWGITSADSSILAITFAGVAVADCILIMLGGRLILVIPALASFALCVESIANGDWLLSQVTYISAAVNAAIAACLAWEYRAWMRGKFGR